MQKTKMKMIRDKVRAIIFDRRKKNKINANSSGIEEYVGPADQPLEEFILEAQEFVEAKRKEQDETTVIEEALVAVGKQI